MVFRVFAGHDLNPGESEAEGPKPLGASNM